MRDGDGGGPEVPPGIPNGGGDTTYLVVADGLIRTARSLRMTADWVKEGTMLGLDDGVETGDDELQEVLTDFASRWQTGAEDLTSGQHSIADRLDETVRHYVETEQAAHTAYGAAGSGQAGPPSQGPPAGSAR